MNPIETIRKAREQAFEAKAEIERKITETRNRINEICKRGIRPFDEAWPDWRDRFLQYADDGKRRLEGSFAEYASPNDTNPMTDSFNPRSGIARVFCTDNDRIDAGEVFAHIHRDAILKQAEAWFKAQTPTVPHEPERREQLEALAEQLKELEAERDDVQDELARLFGDLKPSERTQSAQRREYEQKYLQAINNDNQPSEPPVDVFRSPADGD